VKIDLRAPRAAKPALELPNEGRSRAPTPVPRVDREVVDPASASVEAAPHRPDHGSLRFGDEEQLGVPTTRSFKLPGRIGRPERELSRAPQTTDRREIPRDVRANLPPTRSPGAWSTDEIPGERGSEMGEPLLAVVPAEGVGESGDPDRAGGGGSPLQAQPPKLEGGAVGPVRNDPVPVLGSLERTVEVGARPGKFGGVQPDQSADAATTAVRPGRVGHHESVVGDASYRPTGRLGEERPIGRREVGAPTVGAARRGREADPKSVAQRDDVHGGGTVLERSSPRPRS
jgi:hypothetical protein